MKLLTPLLLLCAFYLYPVISTSGLSHKVTQLDQASQQLTFAATQLTDNSSSNHQNNSNTIIRF